jgi:hypothetical protein
MAKKLPERFLKADPDFPCRSCDKVRKSCRICDNCKECCECHICELCEGAEISWWCDEAVKEYDLHWCNCEPCFLCGKKDDRDNQNYLEGRYEPYCDKCIVIAEKSHASKVS